MTLLTLLYFWGPFNLALSSESTELEKVIELIMIFLVHYEFISSSPSVNSSPSCLVEAKPKHFMFH